jgi:hypothetical protein
LSLRSVLLHHRNSSRQISASKFNSRSFVVAGTDPENSKACVLKDLK